MRTALLVWLVLSACRGKEDAPRAEAPVTVKPGAADPVASFWSWFASNAATLRAEGDLHAVMDRIGAELAKVQPGLFAEIGGGDERLLVITADGDRKLFPLVKRIYDARPRADGWKIVAFRQRANPVMDAIDRDGQRLAPKDVRFVARTAGSELDVRVFVPKFDASDQMKTLVYILLDHTVGEYDMETKIGVIDVASIDEAPADAKPLTELAAAVDALR